VFAGNLTGALDAWHTPFAREFDYWHASRVIAGGTINEFPFFTFFHSDLHPHLLAFPFFIAAFAVAHRVMEIPPAPLPSPWKASDLLRKVWPLFLLALFAGTARAANNWNLPALAILLVFTGVFRTTQGGSLPAAGEALRGALVGGGLVHLLLLWLPTPVLRVLRALAISGFPRSRSRSGAESGESCWPRVTPLSCRPPSAVRRTRRRAAGET
jgi:uncharacterized membrane protein